MLSISNQTALCLTGMVLCGCMQSMPTAESLTRPTVEAFARLSSLAPWRPEPEQAPPVVIADTPTPQPEAAVAPPPEPTKPRAMHRPVARHRPAAAVTLATERRTPIPATPPPATTASETESASPLPVKISCQTTSQPGERVRMECKPVE